MAQPTFRLLILFFALSLDVPCAAESSHTMISVLARPGADTFLAAAPCFVEPVEVQSGKITIKPVNDLKQVMLWLPPERKDDLTVELKQGASDSTGKCTQTGTLQVLVKVDADPQVSTASVQQAFTVLMAAFVLALLLESAFELLFNWRLFQAYFVGRAWRTPIMFAISFAIVKRFELDLLAEVFAAYHGGKQPTSSWISSALTAMIISGGSVGVNRLLVALNFRPAISKKQEETPKPASTEAYVSIAIRGVKPGQKLNVDMQQSDNVNNKAPTLTVITAESGGRLREILFPSRTRFPHSGGMLLTATTKCYRFVITDLASKTLYNIDGSIIRNSIEATEFCFAPRSVVDFVVDLAAPPEH